MVSIFIILLTCIFSFLTISMFLDDFTFSIQAQKSRQRVTECVSTGQKTRNLITSLSSWTTFQFRLGFTRSNKIAFEVELFIQWTRHMVKVIFLWIKITAKLGKLLVRSQKTKLKAMALEDHISNPMKWHQMWNCTSNSLNKYLNMYCSSHHARHRGYSSKQS